MVYLTCSVTGLRERGEIIPGLKRQPAAPFTCWRPISPLWFLCNSATGYKRGNWRRCFSFVSPFSIRLIFTLILMSGSFSLDVDTVMVPLMLILVSLLKIRLKGVLCNMSSMRLSITCELLKPQNRCSKKQNRWLTFWISEFASFLKGAVTEHFMAVKINITYIIILFVCN